MENKLQLCLDFNFLGAKLYILFLNLSSENYMTVGCSITGIRHHSMTYLKNVPPIIYCLNIM